MHHGVGIVRISIPKIRKYYKQGKKRVINNPGLI